MLARFVAKRTVREANQYITVVDEVLGIRVLFAESVTIALQVSSGV
jgi:hypothetical protein